MLEYLDNIWNYYDTNVPYSSTPGMYNYIETSLREESFLETKLGLI